MKNNMNLRKNLKDYLNLNYNYLREQKRVAAEQTALLNQAYCYAFSAPYLNPYSYYSPAFYQSTPASPGYYFLPPQAGINQTNTNSFYQFPQSTVNNYSNNEKRTEYVTPNMPSVSVVEDNVNRVKPEPSAPPEPPDFQRSRSPSSASVVYDEANISRASSMNDLTFPSRVRDRSRSASVLSFMDDVTTRSSSNDSIDVLKYAGRYERKKLDSKPQIILPEVIINNVRYNKPATVLENMFLFNKTHSVDMDFDNCESKIKED